MKPIIPITLTEILGPHSNRRTPNKVKNSPTGHEPNENGNVTQLTQCCQC